MRVGDWNPAQLFLFTNIIYHQILVWICQCISQLLLKKVVLGGGGRGKDRRHKNDRALPIHQCVIPPKFGNNRSTRFWVIAHTADVRTDEQTFFCRFRLRGSKTSRNAKKGVQFFFLHSITHSTLLVECAKWSKTFIFSNVFVYTICSSQWNIMK